MYHRKFGIEPALVRISSGLPEPKDRRMLAVSPYQGGVFTEEPKHKPER